MIEARCRVGCSGPSTFSRMLSARSKSGRAPAKSPCSLSNLARLLRLAAVSGCSGPSTFSRMISARSKSGLEHQGKGERTEMFPRLGATEHFAGISGLQAGQFHRWSIGRCRAGADHW